MDNTSAVEGHPVEVDFAIGFILLLAPVTLALSSKRNIPLQGRKQLQFALGNIYLLVWPKSSFEVCCNILQKSPNELFGQPNKWEQSLILIQRSSREKAIQAI